MTTKRRVDEEDDAGSAQAPAQPPRKARRRAVSDGVSPAGSRGGVARDQATRLQLALADNLATLCRIVWYVADEEPGEDELIACLAVLAHDESEIVPPGRERAWLLRTLVKLLGADIVPGEARIGRELPRLGRLSEPGGFDIPDASFLKLHEALRSVDKPQRASVVLVVQEGLSIAEGARIQGGSRTDFARRVTDGMSALDDELLDALMGRAGGGERV